MTNSEVWHNFKMKHVQSLESSDLHLLKTILNAHSKTASEAFYLEMGILPLRFVLAKRRLMYLWHILSREKTELIYKIYFAQKCKSNKGDWVKILDTERDNFEVTTSDDEISQMSKNMFKTYVDEKIKNKAVKYLEKLGEKHSKTTDLLNGKFEKKKYFSDRRFTKEDIQILFALSTKMLDCKNNFKNQFENNLKCRLCEDTNSVENEEHLLHCIAIQNEDLNITFSDVYGDVDKQYKATQVFKKILRKRKVLIDLLQN